MIGTWDTPPPLPSKRSQHLSDAMTFLGCWCRLDLVDFHYYELYVDPRFYLEARAAVFWTVPAFVKIDVIPMEFTS